MTDWLAHTPPDILAENFGTPAEIFSNISLHGLWIDQTGVIRMIAQGLRPAAAMAPLGTGAAAGALVAVVSNVTNNLPSGLVAGSVVQQTGMPTAVSAAMLIGVDLGPNLSVTGSLATILWLAALRREGQKVSAWQFLRLGLVVMPPALLLALAGILPGV